MYNIFWKTVFFEWSREHLNFKFSRKKQHVFQIEEDLFFILFIFYIVICFPVDLGLSNLFNRFIYFRQKNDSVDLSNIARRIVTCRKK